MAIPVLSVSQMREWEKASWAAGKSVDAVIDQVGRAIVCRLEMLAKPGEQILFLAGKGHNGDDVRAARKHLGANRKSTLLNVTDPLVATGEFQNIVNTTKFAWIVDGLFGIGLDRPLDANWQKFIQLINSSHVPIVAIDVPSGLNAETGAVEAASIEAAVTLTVGAPKQGLLKASAQVGRLEVLEGIGLVDCAIDSELLWTVPGDFARLPFQRPVESNKGTFGHVAIYAGSFGYHGAAALAGHGAMRARPGLVTVYPQENIYLAVASHFQAAMVHVWRAGGELPKGCAAILCGPGLAAKDVPESMKDEMRHYWSESAQAMIVDASALDWLKPGPVPASAIRVITPHPGEAGRMLDSSAAAVQADRVAALRQLSERLGNCYVVLKGHQTLAGRAGDKIFVNSSGNPYLAQGGSGDLLGGFLAGLLAQPEWQKDALSAIRYAVWEHGAAADRLARARNNWTVEDLSRELGNRD